MTTRVLASENTADVAVPGHEPVAPERRFATPDDIPSVGFAEIELPVLKKWVRVRFLGSLDMAAISTLPELSSFTTLMQKQRDIIDANQKKDQDKPDKKLSEEDARALVLERTQYMIRAAHIALVRDPYDTERITCSDCGLSHVPTLWSVEQTTLLHYDDLSEIVTVAERRVEEELDPTSGSSEAQTGGATSGNAGAGE